MPGTLTASCRHCGNPLEGTHTGPCPKCGKTGKVGLMVANETRQRKLNVEIKKISIKEQIKRRPSIAIILTVLFVGALVVNQFDSEFSFVISVILAALGFAILPIKEKTETKTIERYRS